MRARHWVPAVVVLAGVVLAVGTVFVRGGGEPEPAGPVSGPVDAHAGGATLAASIDAAQRRLKAVPKDWSTWAALGSAYVQQARVTGNPAFYPKAEGALRRSLELESATNWQALVGMGALANARHDFPAALDWGRKAEKLNALAGSAQGVIVDALTQLGSYQEARDAVQRMLDVEPGISAFARASYDLELRGDVPRAKYALQRALDDAAAPADIAFCRYYLGELAFNAGDPAGALTEYDRAIAADASYQLAYAGRGKAAFALGRTEPALADYARVTQALPLPELLAEYGDVLAAAGRPDQARQQYDLLAAAQALFAANGVVDKLTAARFAADHDQPVDALTDARAEFAARPNALAADTLAWALHRNGRDEEALPHADAAVNLGWRNAALYYHRGAILAALGDREKARADLTTAMAINPHFDPLQAPAARTLLDTLGGPA
ncbi:tetratricopeptide repeat protein [Asanoa iriomotensis]|uniref:tetratricopeptide repeat protein n=1 Tax=Asanoa iriomotensis TaxID=234613 RepID=UPI0031D998AA